MLIYKLIKQLKPTPTQRDLTYPGHLELDSVSSNRIASPPDPLTRVSGTMFSIMSLKQLVFMPIWDNRQKKSQKKTV